MTQSIGDALRGATAVLSAAAVDEPHREARILLAHALGVDTAGLLRRGPGDVSPDERERFETLVARRAARTPTAVLLGHREFWSLDFQVTADTLIPRPESELIIEAAVELRPGRKVERILDLGTGSGCLLLAALSEFPRAWGLGIDRSEGAAIVAQRNAQRLGFSGRSAIAVGSWTEAITGRFDLILCNPPYIQAANISGLMPEVALYEPRSALDGGADGLDPYRVLFPDLHRRLAPSGTALFEFGLGQTAALLDLAHRASLRVVAVRDDLAGIPRVMILRTS